MVKKKRITKNPHKDLGRFTQEQLREIRKMIIEKERGSGIKRPPRQKIPERLLELLQQKPLSPRKESPRGIRMPLPLNKESPRGIRMPYRPGSIKPPKRRPYIIGSIKPQAPKRKPYIIGSTGKRKLLKNK